MISQKSLNIGGKDFTIQTLPATKGIEAAIVLSHILAGASDGIGVTRKDFLDDTPINFGRIVAGMFERLDYDKTPAFIKDLVLLSVVSPNIDGELYEIEFAGNYELLVDLVVAILEHNKFIDLVKKKASQIMARLSEASSPE